MDYKIHRLMLEHRIEGGHENRDKVNRDKVNRDKVNRDKVQRVHGYKNNLAQPSEEHCLLLVLSP
jgi:hypothetical protein